MSRLWNSGVVLGLWPGEVTVYHPTQGTERLSTGDGTLGWRECLDRFEQWAIAHTRAAVEVVLSDVFSRVMVLAWSAELETREDWSEFARQRVTAQFGPDANWDVQLDRYRTKKNRLVFAVDADLRRGVLRIAAKSRLTLRTFMPHLAAAVNRATDVREGEVLYAVRESECVSFVARRNGDWCHARSIACRADDATLAVAAQRERRLMGFSGDSKLIVSDLYVRLTTSQPAMKLGELPRAIYVPD